MSIFDLAKKAWKVKFGKKEEPVKDSHDIYMEIRLKAEELARVNGVEFHVAYQMNSNDLVAQLGKHDAALFIAFKHRMDKLFPSLSSLEQNHWAKMNKEGSLFSDI